MSGDRAWVWAQGKGQDTGCMSGLGSWDKVPQMGGREQRELIRCPGGQNPKSRCSTTELPPAAPAEGPARLFQLLGVQASLGCGRIPPLSASIFAGLLPSSCKDTQATG